MEKGDNLKAQANLEKSIESYQEAFEKANSIIKLVPKSMRNTIKTKYDETLKIQLNQLLEKADRLKRDGEYIRAIETSNLVRNLPKKITDNSTEEQINSRIINILNQIYVNIIEDKVQKAFKLREMKNFDESIKEFNTALSEANKIGDMELKDNFQSILNNHLYTTRMSKTKNIIFVLGEKYGRLEVSDIAEKCGEEEGLIISTIQDMIMNREISAVYFKKSKAVAFRKQIDIDEYDKLYFIT